MCDSERESVNGEVRTYVHMCINSKEFFYTD